MDTGIEQATADLIHTLGNFLGIVKNCRVNDRFDGPFMELEDLGSFTLDKEPELTAALDKLKHARAVAQIERLED
jgi:hypothetical protein